MENLKFIIAEQDKSKKKGSHSRTINTVEFLEYYNVAKNFDIDIMLEVKDKDISAIKCTNIISEINLGVINAEKIKKEWENYKLLVLERGEESYNLCSNIANGPSIIELYKAIDLELEKEINPIYLKNSLNKAYRICRRIFEGVERKNILSKLMGKEEFISAKTYLGKIVIRNNITPLIESYYFSQS